MQKNNTKAEIRALLLSVGRKLVAEKGTEFLTARKLSEASGCSVGTIYNQFANMDNFIIEQNMQTMAELSQVLSEVMAGGDFYRYLNRLVDAYMDWIANHKNLWLLLYDFSLRNDNKILTRFYKLAYLKLCQKWERGFDEYFAKLSSKERKISRQVLLLSLFSTSSFLLSQSTGKVSKKNICRLLINTYWAGLEVLKRVR